ncbi:MAG: DUF11 domain-containing protein [Candidatus Saccharimonadales bacterium]
MFEKLLAAIPYNPSRIHELAFYSRRMREESSVRRAGMIMLVLAFLIQFFAVISPPQPTVADSSNDLINGGITSSVDATTKCRGNVQNFQQILAAYGVSCDDLVKTDVVSLNSTANNKQLFSMGRLSYGAKNVRTDKPTSETPAAINGVGTFYFRYLWSFDSGTSSTYQALRGTSSGQSKQFFILFNCGNLVFTGLPQSQQPDFTVTKGVRAAAGGAYYRTARIAPGATAHYSVDVANTGNTNFDHVRLADTMPAGLSFVSGSVQVNGVANNTSQLTNFDAGPLARGARLRVSYDAKPATPDSSCKSYTNLVMVTPDTLGGKPYNASVSVCKPGVTPTETPLPTPETPICEYNSALAVDSPDCKPCDKSVSSSDSLACLSRSKAAANLTQNLPDANNTQAHASDKIRYTLSAQNKGKATIKGFVFQENLSDVLDYAGLTDGHGGTIDNDGLITWPAVDIKAGETASVIIDVTVKSPIPNTPQVQGTGRFDHVMTNVYVNTINITLPESPVAVVATTADKLPKTGPGTSLALASIVIMFAGYFYSRSRLLATESNIAIQENTSGGLI